MNHQTADRTGQETIAVSNGYHRYGLPLMHAVAIVYKYAAHNAFIGQCDIGSALHRKYHSGEINLVTHTAQDAPYDECRQQQPSSRSQ